MAYITGEIRDQGSNFSHETRFARLLATLHTKEFFLLEFYIRKTPVRDFSPTGGNRKVYIL